MGKNPKNAAVVAFLEERFFVRISEVSRPSVAAGWWNFETAGGTLRQQVKVLTKHTLWNFKESQRGFKIQRYKNKTCESPFHLF